MLYTNLFIFVKLTDFTSSVDISVFRSGPCSSLYLELHTHELHDITHMKMIMTE